MKNIPEERIREHEVQQFFQGWRRSTIDEVWENPKDGDCIILGVPKMGAVISEKTISKVEDEIVILEGEAAQTIEKFRDRIADLENSIVAVRLMPREEK